MIPGVISVPPRVPQHVAGVSAKCIRDTLSGGGGGHGTKFRDRSTGEAHQTCLESVFKFSCEFTSTWYRVGSLKDTAEYL